MIWGLVTLVILLGAAVIVLLLQPDPEQEVIYKGPEPANRPQPPPAEPGFKWVWHHNHWDKVSVSQENDEGGHPPDTVHSPDPVKRRVPEGAVTKPEFPVVDPNEDAVKAAYKRLEYIKNNPYAWGGVHSERATELIAELMPPPELIDHTHGELIIEQLGELCLQNDPRIAEVLIAHLCYDGGTAGRPMLDALEEIGPPAVPYILPYVRDNSVRTAFAVEVLGSIGVRYRDDLGDILDYIIIPKLETIAADKDNERYDNATVFEAREALEQLR